MKDQPRTVETPRAPDRKEWKATLLVDRFGKPLLVREPRPVGFRPRNG
jgi:hypothetical protein